MGEGGGGANSAARVGVCTLYELVCIDTTSQKFAEMGYEPETRK